MAYIYWNKEIKKSECEKLIKEFDYDDAHSAKVGGKLSSTLSTKDKNKYGISDDHDGFIDIRDINNDSSKKNDNLSEENQNETVRKSKLNWLKTDHIFNKILLRYVTEANNEYFKYNIEKFTPCQFTRYGVGDYYNYHQDNHNNVEDFENATRKLSLTLQLSNPNTYEGGKFLLFNGEKEPYEPPIREQGSIIVFDSRLWHKVTPITKGVRYSLVSWILGPPFK